jgi:hypothetical protein
VTRQLTELIRAIDAIAVHTGDTLAWMHRTHELTVVPCAAGGMAYLSKRVMPPAAVVIIDSMEQVEQRRAILLHEVVELYLMLDQRMGRTAAHRIAEKLERAYCISRDVPLPRRGVRRERLLHLLR